MAFFSVDCTLNVAAIKFSYGQQTVDMNALAFKVRKSDDFVEVIALVDQLISSDEVSYAKKDEAKKWNKCDKPVSPFPVYFRFNKKQYQKYENKEWVNQEPTIYEQFATQWLDTHCDDTKQYSGYFSIAPIRPGTEDDLLNFDSNSKAFAKAEILRDARISINEIDSPVELLTNAEWPTVSSFSGSKKYKSPAESLSDKITAINSLIKKHVANIADIGDIEGLPTDTKLQELSTGSDGSINSELMSSMIEARDFLTQLF